MKSRKRPLPWQLPAYIFRRTQISCLTAIVLFWFPFDSCGIPRRIISPLARIYAKSPRIKQQPFVQTRSRHAETHQSWILTPQTPKTHVWISDRSDFILALSHFLLCIHQWSRCTGRTAAAKNTGSWELNCHCDLSKLSPKTKRCSRWALNDHVYCNRTSEANEYGLDWNVKRPSPASTPSRTRTEYVWLFHKAMLSMLFSSLSLWSAPL